MLALKKQAASLSAEIRFYEGFHKCLWHKKILHFHMIMIIQTTVYIHTQFIIIYHTLAHLY